MKASKCSCRNTLQKAYIALATLSASAGIIVSATFALGLFSRAVLVVFAVVFAACFACGAANVIASFFDFARAPDLCAGRLFLLKAGMIPCLLICGATAIVLLFVVAAATRFIGLVLYIPLCAAVFGLLQLPGVCYGVQVLRLFRQRGKKLSWALAHGIVLLCFPFDVLDTVFLHREWEKAPMNKKNMLTVMALTVATLLVVVFAVPKILNLLAGKIMEEALGGTRATLYGDVPQEKRMLLVGFGDQISHEAMFGPKNLENDVKDYLAYGMDPNYCLKMYDGWQYRNPLMLFCADFLNKSYYEENHIVFNYEADVFNQLIEAGADINKYPYIWAQVYLQNDKQITIFEKNHNQPKENVAIFTSCYVSDCNRVLKLFLDAGADVNRKGNPVPFEEGVCETISEEKIQDYFTSPEATTPLYEAIKKGSKWESQVDLLLEYGAALDESCMEAARLSGDDAMIEKVEGLMRQ